MNEKKWPVREIIRPPFDVAAPERFTNADVIEIQVRITPRRYYEIDYEPDGGKRLKDLEATYSISHVVTLEAKDSRALHHITEQMLWNLYRAYLGVKP